MCGVKVISHARRPSGVTECSDPHGARTWSFQAVGYQVTLKECGDTCLVLIEPEPERGRTPRLLSVDGGLEGAERHARALLGARPSMPLGA